MADSNKTNSHLWIAPAIVPLVILLCAFILGTWYWGLMDDLTILNSGSNFYERFSNYFSSLIPWGTFRPTFVFYVSLFYTIFEAHPQWLYIFKLCWITLTLMIWSGLAFRMTKNKVSLFLLPIVTLSFHYFYDAFFYLSSHEFLGLFFLGLSLHCLWLDHESLINKNRGEARWLITGILCVFLSFFSKETFVAAGMAIGLSFLFESFLARKMTYSRGLWIRGMLFVLCSIGFAASLKIFIQTQYTSSYSFTNIPKIIDSLTNWFKKDFFNHLPWLLICFMVPRVKLKNEIYNGFLWPKILCVFLYICFLGILLPWNTISYYATPLGLFFAFIVSVWFAGRIDALNPKWKKWVAVCALLLNVFVCQYALQREMSYQYDTINFMTWLEKDTTLKGSSKIYSNAMEAGYAIPGFLTRKTHKSFNSFEYNPSIDVLKIADKALFLYSPRFGFIPEESMKPYRIEFYSKNWVLFSNK